MSRIFVIEEGGDDAQAALARDKRTKRVHFVGVSNSSESDLPEAPNGLSQSRNPVEGDNINKPIESTNFEELHTPADDGKNEDGNESPISYKSSESNQSDEIPSADPAATTRPRMY